MAALSPFETVKLVELLVTQFEMGSYNLSQEMTSSTRAKLKNRDDIFKLVWREVRNGNLKNVAIMQPPGEFKPTVVKLSTTA